MSQRASASVRRLLIALSLIASGAISVPAWADDDHAFPQGATFSTLVTTPLTIVGLTGDDRGNLYTAGRAVDGGMCPVWRVGIANPSLVVVGFVPQPGPFPTCAPNGLAFDSAGKLYVINGDQIVRFLPDADHPPVADLFASGLPGARGLAFDRNGNLWTGDGATGLGRVWMISPEGVVVEAFRVQATASELNFGPFNNAMAGGVGRVIQTVPGGTITRQHLAANTGGSQPTVASGLAFDKEGNLLIADTARGAIWKASFDGQGNLQSATGCDATFPANTLCLENVLVAHPLLEGAEGIALDHDGNIWVSVGERNAVVVVTDKGRVSEVFRNAPRPVLLLRNLGPLEFPSSPFLSGERFCTANSDEDRRDNFSSFEGEIRPDTAPRGKISCMDQEIPRRGVPLPVR
jgi:sugar lactone lactonase YvrE